MCSLLCLPAKEEIDDMLVKIRALPAQNNLVLHWFQKWDRNGCHIQRNEALIAQLEVSKGARLKMEQKCPTVARSKRVLMGKNFGFPKLRF